MVNAAKELAELNWPGRAKWPASVRRMQVKTIGIVGGLAWPSTVIYYRTINELVASRLGGLHCARLVLAQTDFAEVDRYQREGRWDRSTWSKSVCASTSRAQCMPPRRLAISSLMVR